MAEEQPKQQAEFKRPEMLIFLAAMGCILAWRLALVPLSLGEMWFAGFFAVLMGIAISKSSGARIPRKYELILILVIGTAYQALIIYHHFKAMGFLIALGGLVMLTPTHEENDDNQSRPNIGGIFFWFIAIILFMVFCLESMGELSAAFRIHRLTHLDPEGVILIRLLDGDRVVKIEDQATIQLFCHAFARTYPYSPNREGITASIDCYIETTEGNHHIHLGRGNRSHAEAVWVELYEARDYQNVKLFDVLQKKLPEPLWK